MRSDRERGFSLFELLIAIAVLAVAGAMAAVLVGRTKRSTTFAAGEAACIDVVRSRVARAAAGAETSFEAAVDLPALGYKGLLANPRGYDPPDGSVLAARIEFEPGSGAPRVDGARVRAAIVIVDPTDEAHATAIVIGTTGTVAVYTYEQGQLRNGWRRRP